MKNWKAHWHEIIFEADTKEGKLFDVILLWMIVISVVLVMLESVDTLNQHFGFFFNNLEWFITILFSIEYIMRILVLKKPIKYVLSFYGIIDLLSIIPKYLSLFIAGSHALIALRSLRLLRMFRILKLGTYVGESNKLMSALVASRTKISVFLFAILILCTILGTVMYLIEDRSSGFTSIPRSIYWAIVTMTTVGYGDIAPQTIAGQFIASIVMILGYGIIAIPTGIVSSEIAKQGSVKGTLNTQSCPNCSAENHADFAKFCYRCGERLEG
ncbi:ion transporter [Jiulongibacter sediminis]|jgi:voltage-gated potassium channel|uniref:Ion transporter n=1 Tax=Jiulongibacter sediminis TaxID=1605367 RepID=A0A0P7BZA1_9BACT|nr:ion transporter [Jiulongibacter sediminis]KPM47537.1 ion transporter [Jiulongibacter sediminis]TBX23331.1 ion transporter [Jiulongibacter sediminis]